MCAGARGLVADRERDGPGLAGEVDCAPHVEFRGLDGPPEAGDTLLDRDGLPVRDGVEDDQVGPLPARVVALLEVELGAAAADREDLGPGDRSGGVAVGRRVDDQPQLPVPVAPDRLDCDVLAPASVAVGLDERLGSDTRRRLVEQSGEEVAVGLLRPGAGPQPLADVTLDPQQ